MMGAVAVKPDGTMRTHYDHCIKKENKQKRDCEISCDKKEEEG